MQLHPLPCDTHRESHGLAERHAHITKHTLMQSQPSGFTSVSQMNIYVQHYICKHMRKVNTENMPFECGSNDSS